MGTKTKTTSRSTEQPKAAMKESKPVVEKLSKKPASTSKPDTNETKPSTKTSKRSVGEEGDSSKEKKAVNGKKAVDLVEGSRDKASKPTITSKGKAVKETKAVINAPSKRGDIVQPSTSRSSKKRAREEEEEEDEEEVLVSTIPPKKQKKVSFVGKTTTQPLAPSTAAVPKSKKNISTKSKPGKDETSDGKEEEDDTQEDEIIQLEAESDESDDDYIHGFETDDDDDSSDEEMDIDDEKASKVKLPSVAKEDSGVQKKLEKAKSKKQQDRGVLYLGRIPHGFYEDEMREYFSQFGTVTRLRISRNKKTGKSKHYGFIEFESSAVAEIVAETMNNYLLMGHLFQCKVIPKEKVHPDLWVGANRKWRKVPRARVAKVMQNMPRTDEQKQKAEKRLLKRQEERKAKIKAAGIDYSFDNVAYTPVKA